MQNVNFEDAFVVKEQKYNYLKKHELVGGSVVLIFLWSSVMLQWTLQIKTNWKDALSMSVKIKYGKSTWLCQVSKKCPWYYRREGMT